VAGYYLNQIERSAHRVAVDECKYVRLFEVGVNSIELGHGIVNPGCNPIEDEIAVPVGDNIFDLLDLKEERPLRDDLDAAGSPLERVALSQLLRAARRAARASGGGRDPRRPARAGRPGAEPSLEDALAADVLLADRLDGERLGVDHGAPIRFVAPAHYGCKSVRHLNAVELWRDARNYRFPGPRLLMNHPRARVRHEERGTVLPPWFFRRVWPALIPPVRWLFAMGLRRRQRRASSAAAGKALR
jgi:hypothetical protein